MKYELNGHTFESTYSDLFAMCMELGETITVKTLLALGAKEVRKQRQMSVWDWRNFQLTPFTTDMLPGEYQWDLYLKVRKVATGQWDYVMPRYDFLEAMSTEVL